MSGMVGALSRRHALLVPALAGVGALSSCTLRLERDIPGMKKRGAADLAPVSTIRDTLASMGRPDSSQSDAVRVYDQQLDRLNGVVVGLGGSVRATNGSGSWPKGAGAWLSEDVVTALRRVSPQNAALCCAVAQSSLVEAERAGAKLIWPSTLSLPQQSAADVATTCDTAIVALEWLGSRTPAAPKPAGAGTSQPNRTSIAQVLAPLHTSRTLAQVSAGAPATSPAGAFHDKSDATQTAQRALRAMQAACAHACTGPRTEHQARGLLFAYAAATRANAALGAAVGPFDGLKQA